MNEQIFTTGQAAKICKVATRTICKWMDAGRLQGYRIPGSQDRRILGGSLLAMMREQGMPIPYELHAADRLLLIGLEEALTVYFKANLRLGGWRVDSAATGFEAGMIIWEARPTHAVICLSLGRSATVEIVSLLRKHLEKMRVWVLAGEDGDCPLEVRLSGADVCYRPVDPAQLAAAIVSPPARSWNLNGDAVKKEGA